MDDDFKRNWLCRFGVHAWKEVELCRAEDIIALMFSGNVCQRCGKLGDPELALDAYNVMRANLRSQSGFRFTFHPAMKAFGLSNDSCNAAPNARQEEK